MSDDTPILNKLTGQESNPLTSYVGDSHASPSVSQASEKEPPMHAGSGLSLLDAFAYYDQDSRSWKMSQACLPLIEDMPSAKFSMIWPRAAIALNGIAYQQVPLAPITTGIDFGLWPTPNRMDGMDMRLNQSPCAWSSQRIAHANKGQRKQLGLSMAVKAYPAGPIPYNQEEMMRQIVKRWPTPKAQDSHGGSGKNVQGGQSLTDVVNGSLNPTWLEWLMGYPMDHTELEVSATLSSRKS